MYAKRKKKNVTKKFRKDRIKQYLTKVPLSTFCALFNTTIHQKVKHDSGN